MHTCIGAPPPLLCPQLTFEVRQVCKGVPEADDCIKPVPWLLQVLLQREPVGLLDDCSTWKWVRAGTPNSLPCPQDPIPASPSPSQAPVGAGSGLWPAARQARTMACLCRAAGTGRSPQQGHLAQVRGLSTARGRGQCAGVGCRCPQAPPGPHSPRTPSVEGLLLAPLPALLQRVLEHLVAGVDAGHLEALLEQHDGVHPGDTAVSAAGGS